LSASLWRLFPPAHHSLDKGHGRIEERWLWRSDKLRNYVDFPYARQAIRIERRVCDLDGSNPRFEISFALTSLALERTTPAQLLDISRGHWSIENRVHWVRDVTFDEDRSQVRKGAAAHAMASLRNIAIALLRLAGAKNIAAALRHCARHTARTMRLIGM